MTNLSDMWMISRTWEMLYVPVVQGHLHYASTPSLSQQIIQLHTQVKIQMFMTRSYSFLPCPDGPEPSITNPGQWWGGEDRRNKSWCPVQLNRLTLWSADDIYDSVNTVYVVLIDFSPCHRSIYMLGFCTIIQKKWLFTNFFTFPDHSKHTWIRYPNSNSFQTYFFLLIILYKNKM